MELNILSHRKERKKNNLGYMLFYLHFTALHSVCIGAYYLPFLRSCKLLVLLWSLAVYSMEEKYK